MPVPPGKEKPMRPFKPMQSIKTGNAEGMALKMQMAQGMQKVIPRGKPQPMKHTPKKRGF